MSEPTGSGQGPDAARDAVAALERVANARHELAGRFANAVDRVHCPNDSLGAQMRKLLLSVADDHAAASNDVQASLRRSIELIRRKGREQ